MDTTKERLMTTATIDLKKLTTKLAKANKAKMGAIQGPL